MHNHLERMADAARVLDAAGIEDGTSTADVVEGLRHSRALLEAAKRLHGLYQGEAGTRVQDGAETLDGLSYVAKVDWPLKRSGWDNDDLARTLRVSITNAVIIDMGLTQAADSREMVIEAVDMALSIAWRIQPPNRGLQLKELGKLGFRANEFCEESSDIPKVTVPRPLW